MSDLFPSTAQAWIESQLERGPEGRAEVNLHIMEVYSDPLRIYYLGGWRGSHGDGEDVVSGFFADRLAREEFLVRWIESGVRLRIWLCKALSYYLKEQVRDGHRAAKVLPLPDGFEPTDTEEPPEAALERAFARSIVQRALIETERECRGNGHDRHWAIFCEHFIAGKTYRQVESERGMKQDGITAAQAAVLVRVVVRSFRKSLRLQLIRDGVKPENIDREIDGLLGKEDSDGR